MIARFGSQEMVRLTTPADQEMDGIVATVANAALTDASALMDGYVARRYRVPMDVAPPAVTAQCCHLARFNLSTGDGKTCSDEVRARHKDAMEWLRDVSQGRVVLDLDEVSADTSQSTAQMCEGKPPMFGWRY